jgi:hypothetical protein
LGSGSVKVCTAALKLASELESAKAFLNAMDSVKLDAPEKGSLLLPSGDADSSLP